MQERVQQVHHFGMQAGFMMEMSSKQSESALKSIPASNESIVHILYKSVGSEFLILVCKTKCDSKEKFQPQPTIWVRFMFSAYT